jgi:hypothetical protein
MSLNYKLSDTFVVPALSGAIAAGVTPVVYGIPFYSNFQQGGIFGGVNVPLAVGVSSFGSTLIGQVAKNWVLPYIPSNSRFAESEGRMLTPVLAGVANMALLGLGAPNDGTMMLHLKNFGVGAGSVVAGQYISDTWLAPYLR